MKDANFQMLELLYEWDPLGYGKDAYETEIVDVIAAAHRFDNNFELAKEIQNIYEFSFEEIIPIKECEKMANQLLRLKNQISCDFPK